MLILSLKPAFDSASSGCTEVIALRGCSMPVSNRMSGDCHIDRIEPSCAPGKLPDRNWGAARSLEATGGRVRMETLLVSEQSSLEEHTSQKQPG